MSEAYLVSTIVFAIAVYSLGIMTGLNLSKHLEHKAKDKGNDRDAKR